MLEMNVTNRLGNGNVLVVAKDLNNPNNQKEYYSVKEENTDRFIKERKGLESANKFQKVLSVGTSIVGGVIVASKMKTNKVISGFVGVLSAVGFLNVLGYVDNKLNEIGMKNLLKRNNAKNITEEMTTKQQ